MGRARCSIGRRKTASASGEPPARERPALTATSLPSADSDFSRGAGSAVPGVVPGGLSRLDLALIGGLVLLSVPLLFWATRDPVLAGGFLAGLSVAAGGLLLEIGRASCRERGGQSV